MKGILKTFSLKKQSIRYLYLLVVLLLLINRVNAQPVTIDSNTTTTWDSQDDVPAMIEEIIIEPDATLNITNGVTVRLLPGGCITVERSGTLYVDNATLTAETTTWCGIQVLGNASLPHSFPDQGFVWIANSTIEHAEYAVYTGYINNQDASFHGGVMHFHDNNLINNKTDVRIGAFNLYGNWLFQNYVGDFQRNHSIIDDNYRFPYNDDNDLEPFMQIEFVKGVSVEGHIFEDQRSIINANRPSGKSGIINIGASTRVDRNETSGRRSEFLNLGYGIVSFLDYYTGGITVKDANFECWHGIYMISSTISSTIENNDFVVKWATNPGNPLPYGLYLDHCQAYTVEHNDFTAEKANTSVGVIVGNRHTFNTEINNNDFHDILIGTEAIGKNRDTDFFALAEGLEYRCNDFSRSLADIYIAEDFNSNPSINYTTGIKHYHYLTANQFSENPGAWLNVYNDPDVAPLYYGHHDDSNLPKLSPNSVYGDVTVQSLTDILPTDYCPENPMLMAESDLSKLMNTKNAENDLYKKKIDELNSMLDAGNSLQLLQQVRVAASAVSYGVYQRVMQQAPFTSNAVLEEVSKKEFGFSNAMIRDILVAHPQAAKSLRIQENLDNRNHQLLPFMRNQIDAGKNVLSAKELAELEAANHRRLRNTAINQAVRILAADSQNRSSEMIDFLSGTDELGFEYRIASIYDKIGDIERANDVLSEIATWEISETSKQDHEAYMELRKLTNMWEAEGKDLTALSGQALDILHDYARRPNMAAGKAIAILKINGSKDYPEPVYLPDFEIESRSNETEEVITTSQISIYPSPAKHYININYQLQISSPEKIFLKISDLSGKVVHQQVLTYTQDEVVISTRHLPAGQYVCNIFADNQTVDNQQFTIVK